MRSTLISEVLWKWYFCVMKLETPQPSWHYWITNTNTIVLKNNWYKTVKIARLPDKAIKNSFPKETNSEYLCTVVLMCSEEHEKKFRWVYIYGTLHLSKVSPPAEIFIYNFDHWGVKQRKQTFSKNGFISQSRAIGRFENPGEGQVVIRWA